MNGAFYIGAAGLDAEQRALDVVANNISNVNTAGYKRGEARFSELVGAQARAGSGFAAGDLESAAADPLGGLSGVSVDTGARVFDQGAVSQTGKPMDVAINGDGFMEVLGPGGQLMLSRGGSLKVNADGYLAEPGGLPLKAMISVPQAATSVTIGADGKVSAQAAGEATATVIGQIDLVRPKDMATLESAGDGLFRTSAEDDLVSAAPGVDGAGTLQSGALEGSNVQLSDEMTALLILQRAYAASAQVVQAGDQLMAIANGLRR